MKNIETMIGGYKAIVELKRRLAAGFSHTDIDDPDLDAFVKIIIGWIYDYSIEDK